MSEEEGLDLSVPGAPSPERPLEFRGPFAMRRGGFFQKGFTFFPDRHILKIGPGLCKEPGLYHFWRLSQHGNENLLGLLCFWRSVWLWGACALSSSLLPASLLSAAMPSLWRSHRAYWPHGCYRPSRCYWGHGRYRSHGQYWPYRSYGSQWKHRSHGGHGPYRSQWPGWSNRS